MDNSGWYWLGYVITAIITFIGVWIWAISEWGFLIGITIGWLPAIISAIIAGFLWPLIALIILYLIFIANK